jgi:hypothetical protein
MPMNKHVKHHDKGRKFMRQIGSFENVTKKKNFSRGWAGGADTSSDVVGKFMRNLLVIYLADKKSNLNAKTVGMANEFASRKSIKLFSGFSSCSSM